MEQERPGNGRQSLHPPRGDDRFSLEATDVLRSGVPQRTLCHTDGSRRDGDDSAGPAAQLAPKVGRTLKPGCALTPLCVAEGIWHPRRLSGLSFCLAICSRRGWDLCGDRELCGASHRPVLRCDPRAGDVALGPPTYTHTRTQPHARGEGVRGAAGMRSAEQRGVRAAVPGGGAALPAGGSGSSRRWAELGVVGGARKSPRPRSAEIPRQRRTRTHSIPCCCSPGTRFCAAGGIAACWRRGEVGCTCSEPAGRCAAKLQIDPN